MSRVVRLGIVWQKAKGTFGDCAGHALDANFQAHQSAGMSMTNAKTFSTATTEIFQLLEDFKPDERKRIIAAAVTLFGDEPTGQFITGTPSAKGRVGLAADQKSPTASASDPKAFFDGKKPHSKIEELAVAARFRESSGNNTHEKADFEQVIRAARRDFNANKFRRDLANAKTAGFFNRGDGNPLSHFGQNYVDALPDRDAVKDLDRPKAAARRRPAKTSAKAKA